MAKKDTTTATTPAKTKCPITVEQFRKSATPMTVKIGESMLAANTKEFSTGSFGWFANDKITVLLDGVPVKVQVGINLTVVGSKPE